MFVYSTITSNKRRHIFARVRNITSNLHPNIYIFLVIAHMFGNNRHTIDQNPYACVGDLLLVRATVWSNQRL